MRALIRKLSHSNPGWGAARIDGELLKLSFGGALPLTISCLRGRTSPHRRRRPRCAVPGPCPWRELGIGSSGAAASFPVQATSRPKIDLSSVEMKYLAVVLQTRKFERSGRESVRGVGVALGTATRSWAILGQMRACLASDRERAGPFRSPEGVRAATTCSWCGHRLSKLYRSIDAIRAPN